jgi:hypothetical protein
VGPSPKLCSTDEGLKSSNDLCGFVGGDGGLSHVGQRIAVERAQKKAQTFGVPAHPPTMRSAVPSA